MSRRNVRRLARLVFDLTRRESWDGGCGNNRWPEALGRWPFWSDAYWSLSPEVELAGHRMRVCVSSRDGRWHEVLVLTDGRVRHPGGRYWVWDEFRFFGWTKTWSTRIAEEERAEGGLPGPVDRRDLAIEAAEALLAPPSQASAGRLSVAKRSDDE